MNIPRLSENQKQAMCELAARLKALADAAPSAAQSALVHEPLRSNVLGILGVRGAGKSTLLLEIYNCEGQYKDLFMLRPLDCSLLSPGTEPGTGVLLHLAGQLGELKELRKNEQHKKVDWWKEFDKQLKELEDLVGRYARVEASYRELCLELASSPGDYDHYVTTGLRERFKLRKDLAVWLSTTLKHLQRRLFVVLLDDFDLVPAAEVRRWLVSLLDELRQPRLIFILTADFYRLEHLSFSPGAEFDDKTGRALLNKLLSSQNRVNLERWKLGSRKDFKPKEDDPHSLWALVQPAIGGTAIPEALVATLLPAWPRGLVDLHESLARGAANEDRTTHFLHLLATSRNESLLARRVMDIKPEDWVQMLRFADEDVSVEDWRGMIEVAAARLHDSSEVQPLRNLRPMIPQQEAIPPMPGAGHSDTMLPSAIVSTEAPIPFGYDPTAPDALRHDLLRILPLRDAADADQALWAELLIDLGLRESARHRAHLLRTWQPIARRLARARFRLALPKRDLCRFFEDNDNSKLRPALYWLRVPAGPFVEIGWEPLIEALRGARDPLLSELLAELLIDTGSLEGDLPPTQVDQALALLPKRLWALLLLVDALDRCPWAALSGPLGWRLTTYLGLAAAFVRSSYAYAIKTSRGDDDPLRFSKEQKDFIEMLDQRNPRSLLRLHEEDVLERLCALFADGFKDSLQGQDNPLAHAALAYLDLQVYTLVVNLISALREREKAGQAE
jgi:hypothetical protein